MGMGRGEEDGCGGRLGYVGWGEGGSGLYVLGERQNRDTKTNI